MDKKDLFEQFRQTTSEIADHAEDVAEVKFQASLKNGTKFSFVYDSENFDVVKKKEVNSAVNGVSDIISALVTVALLALTAVKAIDPSAWLAAILVNAFFICYYIISSVYHLFSVNHIRTSRVLLLVRHVFLLLSLTLMTLEITLITGSSTALVLFSGVAAVLSLFLALLTTKGGMMASDIMIAVIALIMMTCSGGSIYAILIASSVIINAVVNALFTGKKTMISKTAGTSSLFYLLSQVFLFFLAL